MFKDFDEILRGFTTEEYAYALHVTLISYLDSIGILNQDRYYKFLNTNFENTLKDVHQVVEITKKRIIEEMKRGNK